MSSLLASIPRTYPASLLLNFDGANNSTTFTDSSIYNHTGTAYGNAKISTTQSKFGGSSGYFDGTGDYVQYSANSSFAFGTGPFSVDFWIRAEALPSNGNIAGIVGTYSTLTSADTTHWWIGLDNRDSVMRLTVTRHGDNAITANAVWTPSLNVWYHVAVTKNSNNEILIFIDGVGQYVNITGTWSSYNVSNNGPLGVGLIATPFYFNGYIDNLRIVKGVSLYSGTAIPLPNVPSLKDATMSPKLFNHIILTSTKSSGDITGSISTSTGYYTVNYWDGTKITYSSGSNFAKAAIGGNQSLTIFPSLSNGTLSGSFLNVDLSNNNIISIRPFYSRFIVSAGTPGYSQYGYFYYSYYYRGWRWNWIPGVPSTAYHLDVSSNSLDSSSLNQIYTDLLNGDGTIDVSDNTGGDSDDPSIATAKGYTVYGSVAPYTTLLLNLNSNYTDSSSQNISVSGLGGSPAFSTSIKKYGSASLSFNGGNVGNSSFVIPDLSQVDYTIEFWIYRPTATNSYEGVINLSNGGSSAGVNIHLYNNNDVNFNDGQAGATAGGTIGATQWYHVACVSKNSVKKLFIDGILISSATQATPAGPYKIKIGATYTLSETSNAYIDDVKIIRGKALYDNDFVPPSSELTTSTATATPGTTALLLRGNGTNNGTTFTDDGHKVLTPTRNGNTITSTAQYKYGTASIYFDGTGDYLSYSTGKDNFNFLNSNFTIECWIRPSNVTGARVIFSKRANTGTYGGFIFQCNGNKLNILATDNGSSWGINLDSTSTLSTNTWYHVAATRLYDTFKIFIDGDLQGSQTIENFIISPNTANVVIGAGGATGGQEFFGYIDDLRIVRGASVYNTDFTSPSSELGLYP